MAAPKDPEHDDTCDERGHVLECSQKRFDIVGDLLRGDYQHRDCEGKGGGNKIVEPRHVDAAQPKTAKPRQGLQVWWQSGRGRLCEIEPAVGEVTAMEAARD